jgi:hypothetical protein
MSEAVTIPCPVACANGKGCQGHIEQVGRQ